MIVFFFKQKTAYEMRISDWSSDVCSSDLFWKRQMVEIDKIIGEHRATHKDVKFFDRERFNEAGWAKDGDPAVSTAVIIATEDGSVEIKTGMVPPAYLSNEREEGAEGTFVEGAKEAFAEEHENRGSVPTAKADEIGM